MRETKRWPAEMAGNPLARALAFAAAGALTAAKWDRRTQSLEEGLDAIVAEAAGRPIAWQYPSEAIRAAVPGVDLASAWRDSHNRHFVTGTKSVARLLVDTSSLPAGLVASSLGSAMAGISRSLAAPSLTRSQWEPLISGDIGSVSFSAFREAVPHDWEWPLRVGVPTAGAEGLADALGSTKAAGRGFLDVEKSAAGHDLFVLTEGLAGAVRQLQDLHVGLAVVGADAFSSRRAMNRLMNGWLRGENAVPTAFLDLAQGALSSYLSHLAYEMSHDLPLDEAVFAGYRRLWWERSTSYRLDEMHPPIILAPQVESGAVFDNARLAHRVDDLQTRLDRLPGNVFIGEPAPATTNLGIQGYSRTVADYREDLRRTVKAGGLIFDEERQGATGLRQINDAVAEAIDAEQGRFTDPTLYRGHLWPKEDLAQSSVVPDDEPLVAGEPYTIGVAIRRKRTGIDSAAEAKRTVANPRRKREDLQVYVFVRSSCPSLSVESQFQSVVWPYDQDSETVPFRLTVGPPLDGRSATGTLEILLYHSTLDLLDRVETTLTIVPANAASKKLPARKLTWPGEVPGVHLIDDKMPARLASIHVSAAINGYCFDFKFRNRLGTEIVIPAAREIGSADLTGLLERVRDFWTRLVIGPYSERLTVSPPTFRKNLADLADIGRAATILLFGDGYADRRGAGETIGGMLERMERSGGDLLQITYSGNAKGFVFPWNLVYPRSDAEADVDINAFWGMRYQIEQVQDGQKVDGLEDVPTSIAFTLDPGFGNSKLQQELFNRYATAEHGGIRVTGPMAEARDLFSNLSQDPCRHLYYFFCHGWAPSADGVLPADSRKLIEKLVEQLAPDARKPWESLLALLPQMGKQAWMFIGNAQVDEGTLRKQKFFERRRPIVFLNMCHSAALLPSMTSGLARIFFDRNASALIGTESPMTPVFAHAFAEQVLDKMLLDGDPVGVAMRKARAHFTSGELRNPLGLAYTLYGRATAHLGPEPANGRGA